MITTAVYYVALPGKTQTEYTLAVLQEGVLWTALQKYQGGLFLRKWQTVDLQTVWGERAEAYRPLVLHRPHFPLIPPVKPGRQLSDNTAAPIQPAGVIVRDYLSLGSQVHLWGGGREGGRER